MLLNDLNTYKVNFNNMFLRGGLLIEPWAPYKFYTNNPRIQSVVLYNNVIYVCSESHQSSDNFQDNVSKFTVAVSGGGTGGADLSERYAGEWNLNVGGSASLVEAFPDPNKSTGYITISNDLLQFVGDDFPNTLGGSFYDYVVANGASPINSGTRSMKVNIHGINRPGYYTVFGVLNNNNTVNDLMDAYDNIPSTASGIIFSVGYSYIDYYVVNNGVIDESSTIMLLDRVEGEPLYFDLDTDTGAMELTVTGNSDRFMYYDSNTSSYIPVAGNTVTLPVILDLANFQTDTFAPYYGFVFETPSEMAQYTSSLTFDLGTTDDGRLPFLSVQIEPPLDAADGKVYKVVGNGTYSSNPPIYSGDYVEFSENLQKLIITRPAPTNAEIRNTALAIVVEELEQGGVIYNSNNEFNTQTLVVTDGFNNFIFASSSYVELSDGGVTSTSIIDLPFDSSQGNIKVGQRLYIMSTFTSPHVYIYAQSPGTQIGLPIIEGVTEGTTYEYVIVRIVGNAAVWLRIK